MWRRFEGRRRLFFLGLGGKAEVEILRPDESGLRMTTATVVGGDLDEGRGDGAIEEEERFLTARTPPGMTGLDWRGRVRLSGRGD